MESENILSAANGVEAALDAGREIGRLTSTKVETQDGGELVFVPASMRTEKIEPLNPKLPEHVTEKATMIEQEDFCDYVLRFKNEDTVIFADPAQGTMKAVLNYHHAAIFESKGVATANHASNIAIFECGFDPEYKRWREMDRKEIGQQDFAYFVEEMMHTIGSPDGADLLEMAQDLKVNRGVVFKQNVRIKDGTVDIQYEENDQASTKRQGKITVPDEIIIVAPIYMLREKQSITAKLRYRISAENPLSFRIDILNRKVIELAAFQKMIEEVRGQTGCPVWLSRT